MGEPIAVLLACLIAVVFVALMFVVAMIFDVREQILVEKERVDAMMRYVKGKGPW